MEDPDGYEVEGPETHVILVSKWIDSDPDEMRAAFNILMDEIYKLSKGVIDWGTLEFDTIRAIHGATGREMHLFAMGVKEMR